MIKVVIDTGGVVSAAFRDRVPEEVIIFIVENDRFQWVASREILDEYNEVLARKKFELPADILGAAYLTDSLWSLNPRSK